VIGLLLGLAAQLTGLAIGLGLIAVVLALAYAVVMALAG
jgi:hypothetical protein